MNSDLSILVQKHFKKVHECLENPRNFDLLTKFSFSSAKDKQKYYKETAKSKPETIIENPAEGEISSNDKKLLDRPTTPIMMYEEIEANTDIILNPSKFENHSFGIQATDLYTTNNKYTDLPSLASEQINDDLDVETYKAELKVEKALSDLEEISLQNQKFSSGHSYDAHLNKNKRLNRDDIVHLTSESVGCCPRFHVSTRTNSKETKISLPPSCNDSDNSWNFSNIIVQGQEQGEFLDKYSKDAWREIFSDVSKDSYMSVNDEVLESMIEKWISGFSREVDGKKTSYVNELLIKKACAQMNLEVKNELNPFDNVEQAIVKKIEHLSEGAFAN